MDEFPRRGRHLGSPSLLRGFSGRRRRLRRHHLHGGVVFIDPSRPGALPVSPWSWVASAGGAARRLVLVDGSKGVADPSWRWATYVGGQGSLHGCRFWLLAADRGGWCCVATVSAAWDFAEGWRLWLQHHGMTWLAADCGGLSSLAGLFGAVHHRKMAPATSSTC